MNETATSVKSFLKYSLLTDALESNGFWPEVYGEKGYNESTVGLDDLLEHCIMYDKDYEGILHEITLFRSNAAVIEMLDKEGALDKYSWIITGFADAIKDSVKIDLFLKDFKEETGVTMDFLMKLRTYDRSLRKIHDDSNSFSEVMQQDDFEMLESYAIHELIKWDELVVTKFPKGTLVEKKNCERKTRHSQKSEYNDLDYKYYSFCQCTVCRSWDAWSEDIDFTGGTYEQELMLEGMKATNCKCAHVTMPRYIAFKAHQKRWPTAKVESYKKS